MSGLLPTAWDTQATEPATFSSILVTDLAQCLQAGLLDLPAHERYGQCPLKSHLKLIQFAFSCHSQTFCTVMMVMMVRQASEVEGCMQA